MKKTTAYILFAAFLAASCQQQEEVDILTGERVRFSAGIESSLETKSSSEDTGIVGIPTGEMGFTLDFSTSEGIGTTPIVTKGTQYNTTGSQQNLSTYAGSIDEILVWGYNGDATTYINGETATEYDGVWDTDNGHYWKTQDKKTFYSCANLPSSGVSMACSSTAMTMTVSSIPAKAENQTDVLMASYKSGADEKINNIPLTFQHAMTAVVFKKGNVEGTFDIKSISLSGVHASGVATMAGTSFSWGSESGSATVTASADDAFLLIPQDLAAKNVTATIVFNNGTKDVTIQTVLNTGSWEVGKTNTYTINYAVPNLSVAVDYTNNGSSVSGISITKTGIMAYVRAAIVCHMVDDDGLVHSTAEGTMSGFNSTDWEKGTDGFYYYKNPVSSAKDASGTVTNQVTTLNSLCTGYTLPAESGLTCRFNIAAQAVQYDPSKTCQQAFN